MFILGPALSVLWNVCLGEAAFSCQHFRLITSKCRVYQPCRSGLLSEIPSSSLVTIFILPASPSRWPFGISSPLRGGQEQFAFSPCLLYVFAQYLFVIFIVFFSLCIHLGCAVVIRICSQNREQEASWCYEFMPLVPAEPTYLGNRMFTYPSETVET